MQGQKSAIDSLPDSINFDYGSTSNNMGIDQQIFWNTLHDPAESRLSGYRIPSDVESIMGTGSQDAHNLMSGWSMGEPSSSHQQNMTNHDQIMTQNGWSSVVRVPSGTIPRLEGQINDAASVIPRNGVNLNLNSIQVASSASFFRTSNSGSTSQSHDISLGQLGQVGDLMECSHLSKSSELEHRQTPYASSSRSGGFLLDEDDGRPGYSLDGRRLSCKRKTIEGNVGSSISAGRFPMEGSMWQTVPPRSNAGSSNRKTIEGNVGSSSSASNRKTTEGNVGSSSSASNRKSIEGNVGSSSSASNRKTIEGNDGLSSSFCFPMEGSMWQTVPPRSNDGSGNSLHVSSQLETSLGASIRDPENPRLRLSMGGVPAGSVHAPPHMSIGAANSHRNYRVRTNPTSLQDPLQDNLVFSRVSVGHSDVPAGHLPLRFAPINPSPHLSSPIHPDNTTPEGHPAALCLPGLRRNAQSVRWTASSSRAGTSSAPLTSVEMDPPLHEDLNSRPLPRNISEHPMFMPSVEGRSTSPHNATGFNLNGVAVGASSRHIGSSSRARPGSSSRSSSGPTWGSSHHTPSGPSPSQYSRRLSEYVRRTLLSSAGAEGGSTPAQHLAPSSQEPILPSAGGTQGHNPPFFRSAMWDRRDDGVAGIQPSLRALAAGSEGRSRLVSEIRNVLDMMRRGEGLRFEDVMLLDPTVLFGMADIHDQHREMRLDIDNMSYEELLALEERIGIVSTGLSEETILARLKRRKYSPFLMAADGTDIEPCCVCQEEYKNEEDMGTLDCGHDFHADCIKIWLGQKNSCPICKSTGLA